MINYSESNITVLILVVMDDALVHFIRYLYVTRCLVLILVVMDDALVLPFFRGVECN